MSPQTDAARVRHDWSARARATVQGAMRYSRFVALMKRALPAAAFAIIVAVLGFFFVARQPSKLSMTYESLGHVENDLAMTAGTLALDGGLQIFSDRGYQLQSARAAVDINKGIVVGPQEVTGQGPLGTLRADRFRFDRASGQLALDGHVEMSLIRTGK